MAKDYFVLSNFDAHYFMLEYTDSSTIPASASAADEINGVLDCNIGEVTKENTKYRTLNGDGWESVASLGNSAEDGTFNCIRLGTGNPYLGATGEDTYIKIRDWFMKATKDAGVASPKCIVEVIPRGSNQYEGTLFYVVPATWTPGTRDTETGQEYSFTVTPFGPQTPIKVTNTAGTWTFAAVDSE